LQLYGEIYRRAMFPLWDSVIHRRPTLGYLRRLEQSQWWSPDELARFQGGELRRLLCHAHANVPFYRERFDEAGIDPSHITSAADLQSIPLLTRDDAQESTPRRKSLVPPFASVTKNTSGSTGQPLSFEYEADSEAWRQAVRMRGYGWAGYREGNRTLHLWSDPPRRRRRRWRTDLKHRVWVATDRGLRRDIYMDSTVRSPGLWQRTVEVIRQKRPHAIVCYSQAGVELARHVVASDSRDWETIPVLCGAEPLLPGDRAILQQAFGPAVFETYGNREVMLMATECEEHDGLHLQAENLVVEVVVRSGDTGEARPAAPGEVGEVVVTDLHNLAMPFVRYVTGDLATAADGSPCRCGRGLPRIASVEGRTSDFLEDGAGREVSGIALMTLFVDLAPAVRQFQVVQRADRSLTVRVVPTPKFDDSARARIHSHCEHYLPGVPVTIDVVEAIDPGPGGKRRFVVRESG
jgi:phenylacetate-CoA ligase